VGESTGLGMEPHTPPPYPRRPIAPPSVPYAPRMLSWMIRLAKYGAVALASGFVVFVSADTWLSHSLPDLEIWHRVAPEGEFTAEMAKRLDFAAYLALEDEIFRELDREVYAGWDQQKDSRLINRYRAGSISDPRSRNPNYNRSFELPVENPRGAVVLVHGLTDSPYSMRGLAESFNRFGYHTIALRLPGHGTTPAALDGADWRDWAAALSLAIDYAIQVGGGRDRLYLVGYSAGGALVLDHVLEALVTSSSSPTEAPCAGLFLFAPSLGVTPLARFANVNRIVSGWKVFEKARWLSVMPEYDPYKYNSFPKNGGRQVQLLASHVSSGLARVLAGGSGLRLPPILIFQSLVDDTVDVMSVEAFFHQLPEAHHELVVFDINHAAVRHGLIRPGLRERSLQIFGHEPLNSTHTLITNEDPKTNAVKEQSWAPGAEVPTERQLSLRWPSYAFSLSHLALPFPPSDPLYGDATDSVMPLGRINLKGERRVMVIPDSQMVRLRHNPFYDYVEQRIGERVASRSAAR